MWGKFPPRSSPRFARSSATPSRVAGKKVLLRYVKHLLAGTRGELESAAQSAITFVFFYRDEATVARTSDWRQSAIRAG